MQYEFYYEKYCNYAILCHFFNNTIVTNAKWPIFTPTDEYLFTFQYIHGFMHLKVTGKPD